MKNCIRKSKQIEKYLEIVLKAIPIVVTLFFIGSVFFNFGYFRNVDLSLISLLSLSDYYEGSLFSVYYILMFTLVLMALYVLVDCIFLLYETIKCLFYFPYLYISILIRSFIVKKKANSIINKLDKDTRKLRSMKDFENSVKEEKKLFRETQQNLIIFIKNFLKSLLKLMLVFVFTALFAIVSIYCIYLVNWRLLIIIFILFVFLKIQQKYRFTRIKLFFVLSSLFFYGMFDLGNQIVFEKPGKEIDCLSKICPTRSKVYVNIEKEQYQLMRVIGKGVLVKKENEILFFKWEDVENLYQQKAN